MATIEIEGLDKLQKKLEAIGKGRVLANGIKAATAHVKGKIDKYPPATEANDPSQKRWYQRGYGPKWRVKSGEIHSRKTSETLGRKWTTRFINDGMTGIVGNNVSYSPFVHDPEEQTPFHAAHGWKTTATVAKEEAGAVRDFILKEIHRALNG